MMIDTLRGVGKVCLGEFKLVSFGLEGHSFLLREHLIATGCEQVLEGTLGASGCQVMEGRTTGCHWVLEG